MLQERFREVLGHFISGITVVTSIDDEGPCGFTCQSFMSLSLIPPLVTFAPAKTSTTWPRIKKQKKGAINVLSQSQQDVAATFAVSGGDKFQLIKWHTHEFGVPILEGVLAWVEFEIHAIHDGGDHDLVVAKVVDLDRRPGKPLMYFKGEYQKLS